VILDPLKSDLMSYETQNIARFDSKKAGTAIAVTWSKFQKDRIGGL
jgi:hypothetical protein